MRKIVKISEVPDTECSACAFCCLRPDADGYYGPYCKEFATWLIEDSIDGAVSPCSKCLASSVR